MSTLRRYHYPYRSAIPAKSIGVFTKPASALLTIVQLHICAVVQLRICVTVQLYKYLFVHLFV